MTTTTPRPKNAALIALRTAVAKGGSVYCHADAVHDRPSYSDDMVFNFSIERNGITTKGFLLPGRCRNGHDDTTREVKDSLGNAYIQYAGVYRPTQGFFSLNGCNDFIAVLESFPDDAAVSVEVYLDAGSNELCVRAGLHCDHVYVKGTWTRGRRVIERCHLVKASTGQHNSARFGSPRG